MAIGNVVALAGGVGGAKLALGLSRILSPDRLTVVVNTGDDFCRYGLAISPDLDTVTYTLAGIVNPEFGWGLAGDTTCTLDTLAQLGEDTWFKLGDRDLATHLLRTGWLSEGHTLTEVTRRLCVKFGIAHSLLPMADTPIRTMVDTVEYGWLEFQEYFVRYHWQPTIRHLDYQGAEVASLTPQVMSALTNAALVVICPSNPLLSIAPILAVPGVRDAVAARPCVAVSPIIAGQAVKGPAAKIMHELGWSVSAPAVADYYGLLLDGFVLDEQDVPQYSESDFKCRLLVANTVMKNDQDKIRLAHEVLSWAEGFVS
jgi:LPPG:FO 2-phospho-L-lactate transferase